MENYGINSTQTASIRQIIFVTYTSKTVKLS